ncbi:MAG: hypothetical protein BWY57_02475 [Betaproteobacteria bacterium ADurb.Bin341]|nr:MAG: hypothetical protein BWY57_02475 [Betaproteobacteria bacterium ADurb.Bin341]
MTDVGKGVEHGLQMAAAQAVIEIVAERLEIDIGGVHDGEKLPTRLRVDIAGGDRDVQNA